MEALSRTLIDSWRHCGLKVLGCWSDDSHGDGQTRFRNLPYWMLLVVRYGSVERSSSTGTDRCGENQAGLFAPDSAGRWRFAPGSRAAHVLFTPLPAASWRSPWQYLQLPAIAAFDHHADLDHLLELHDGDDGWPTLDQAMEARFVFDRLLWRFIRTGLQTGAIEPKPPRPEWLDALIRAASAACGDAGFGVQDLVRLAGCSHSHLCRTLRASDGRTPAQLLRFLRINKAAHLVRHAPGITTTELAERCGYTSERRLRRQFKEQTGMNLSEARRSSRKN